MPRDHVSITHIALRNVEEAFKVGYLTNVIQLSFGVLIEWRIIGESAINSPYVELKIYSKVEATAKEAIAEYERQLKR